MSPQPDCLPMALAVSSAGREAGFFVGAKRPDPTGSRLVRLADIPLEVRLRAAELCMAEARTDEEAARLFELVYDPGDVSGRVSA